MKRKLSIAAVGLVVVLAVAWGILVGWSLDPHARPAFPLDIDLVRALAGRGPTNPRRINAELIETSNFPAAAPVAGDSLLRKVVFSNASYQLVYSNGKTVIIDTANDQHLHDKWSNGSYYPDRYGALQAAMKKAEAIVITHEHFDHLGGISRSEDIDAIRGRVRLTAEQLTGPTLDWAEFRAGYHAKLTPLRYETTYRLSPGVVLIKAPGHTTGSQMIYVRLNTGTEYLFVGDISWQVAGIERLRSKALVAALMAKEDRTQVMAQLVTLHRLLQTTKIHIVVSHDMAQLRGLWKAGNFGDRFE